MKEDFVPFELAKKLKDKGYPQVKKNTLAMYNEDGEWHSLSATLDMFEYCFDDFDEHDCVAPTIFQALKWLREEKGYHICVSICDNPVFSWCYEITKIDGVIFFHAEDGVNTYEQAALAGIEYVLDNLI